MSHPTTFLPLAAGYADLAGHHRHLLDDTVRTSAFLRAVREVVRPGAIVADVGTGTGVLAIAARRAGAARVYAVERTPIVQLARKVAQQNRVDGIEWIAGDARSVELPERVDVIVSECFGPLAIGSTMIAAVASLRDRYMQPNGCIIPGAIHGWLAPVASRREWEFAVGWARPRYGIDWSAAAILTSNNVYNSRIARRDLLAPAAPLFTLDLQRDTFDGALATTLRMTTTRGGRLYGFAGWFTAALAPKVTLSTAPGARDTIWRQVFFPLRTPIALRRGAPIEITFATMRADREHLLWFDWRGTAGDTSFAQSTRYSVPDARIV